MAWVESASPSFLARHDSTDADDAERLLESLERTRERLEDVFPRTVGGMTVVLHRSSISLAFANPAFPLAWLTTAPAARRYVAGFAARSEIHVLTPALLLARASKVAGSREMLSLTASALFARRVIAENNHDLHGAHTAGRMLRELRWAWLVEGAARWFSGQTDHARPAIARRLHEGHAPDFPPGLRDAALLGGTVIDLLVREEGELAAAQLACRLHPQGSRAAITKAFGGRSFARTEQAWRSHLSRLAQASRLAQREADQPDHQRYQRDRRDQPGEQP